MRPAALALSLLLLAPAARAGEDVPRAAPVVSAVLLLPSGERLAVEGGGWMRDDIYVARMRELAHLRAAEKQRRRDTLVLVAGALVLGAAGGYAVARVVR